MPCYEPSEEFMKGLEAGSKTHAQHHPDDQTEIRRQTDRANKAEAAVCAMFVQLGKIPGAEQVISQASRHGKIDLMGMWNVHHKSDRSRLAKALHHYSKDEQDILRDLLK